MVTQQAKKIVSMEENKQVQNAKYYVHRSASTQGNGTVNNEL